MRSGEVDLIDFVVTVFPGSSSLVDDLVHSFTDAVVMPMVRELQYRLEDILEELPSDNAEAVGLSVVQVITNTGTLVQQVAPGAHGAVMTTTVDAPRLKEMAAALKEAVARTPFDATVKQQATDIANAVAEEAQSASPRSAVLKSWLASLPRVADIARIVDAFMSLIGS